MRRKDDRMGIGSKIRKAFKLVNSKEKIAIPTLCGIDSLLEGKTALVTGGSSGIGFAIAKMFLSVGCKVIIAGTNEDKIKRCCDELDSCSVKGIVINLNEIGKLKDKVDEAAGLFGNSAIDILVNCAGVNPKKNFFDISEEDFDKTMDTNVKGTFFMCQTMANYMINNKVKGHILNISSSSALRPAWSPYEMSKWTIKGFTVGLADTLLPYGIIVNAIAPGLTATPMLGKQSDCDLDLWTSPIGRFASPDEIANLATILVSDLGNLVIGDTLYATGGSGVISLHR